MQKLAYGSVAILIDGGKRSLNIKNCQDSSSLESKVFGTKYKLCDINKGIFAQSRLKLSVLTKDATHTYAASFFHQNKSICEDIPIVNDTGPDECSCA